MATTGKSKNSVAREWKRQGLVKDITRSILLDLYSVDKSLGDGHFITELVLSVSYSSNKANLNIRYSIYFPNMERGGNRSPTHCLLTLNFAARCSFLVIQKHSQSMNKSKNIKLVSWNVHTFQDSHSAPEWKETLVIPKLKKYNIDIAELSETCLAASSQLFFWCRRNANELCYSGVSFTVKAEIATSLYFSTKGISDGMMILTLELDYNTLVGSYAPTITSTKHEKDKVYDQLREVQLLP